MFCTILLELFLPFRLLKETANIRGGGGGGGGGAGPVAPERKIGAAAKLSLKHTADCTAPQSQIDWTIPPLKKKSQIAQEYGLLPADDR